MKRILLMLACLVALGLSVAGCGGSDDTTMETVREDAILAEPEPLESPEGEVLAIVDEFKAAIGSGDGKTTCALMYPERTSPDRVCISIYEGPPSDFFASFRDAEVEEVVVDGNKAKVTFSTGNIVHLRKSGAVWAVDEFGGAENTVPGSDARNDVRDAAKTSALATAISLWGDEATVRTLAEEACPQQPVDQTVAEIAELIPEYERSGLTGLEQRLEAICPRG